MHGNVKFTVQWGSPCWELWICALFNKIVNKIFSEDFAQQLSIIVQIFHISIIPQQIEEMGMTIILKLLFLHSLLASNVHIFVCVFLFFHLSLFMPLPSVLALCFFVFFFVCVFFRLCPLFCLCFRHSSFFIVCKLSVFAKSFCPSSGAAGTGAPFKFIQFTFPPSQDPSLP